MIQALVRRSLVAAVALVATAQAVTAQSIASQVARVRDGQVRLSFRLRPGVCGSGTSVWRSRNNTTNWGRYNSKDESRDVEYDDECSTGPGRVVMEMREGKPSALRFYVGGRWRASPDVTDLGQVSAKVAAEYLVSLAEQGSDKASRDAIFPATIADSSVIWPGLIRIARNETRPRETRRQAAFWLGQLAEEPATKGLNDLVGDDGIDTDVREQAVFALSQRPRDEAVPALIQIVRTNRDPSVRKKALFWLGQTNDPRALDLIEELLAKKD